MTPTVCHEYVRAVVAVVREELGATLYDAYQIGSLAHGGFSGVFSDIDIALLLTRRISSDDVAALANRAKALDPSLGARLSVFWSDAAFSFGRFPILDRVDLIDHGVSLCGAPRQALARPDVASVRRYLLGEPVAYWSAKTDLFASASAIATKDQKELVRAFLYPARFLYSWNTGRITSNDAAVDHLSALRPDGVDLDVVRTALACRNGAASFSNVFEARAILPAQRAAVLRFAASQGEARP